MPIDMEQKKAVVADVTALANAATIIIVANYQGMTAMQFDEMRKTSRERGVHLRVVKNRLAAHALKHTPFVALAEKVSGPLVYAFAGEDLGAAGRLLKEYSTKLEVLDVCWIAHKNEVSGDQEVLDFLANLPTREEAIAQLLATLKSPAEKLVRTMSEIPGKLVRLLEAIRRQRQNN